MSGGGYERSDARLGPIVTFAVGLVILCTAVFLGGAALLRAMNARADAREPTVHPMARPGTPPPGPLLQANPEQEYRDFQRAQSELVRGYQWIDRPAGVVRVPIERAMDLVLEEGLD